MSELRTRMIHRPRLRLTLPPLSPREALTLSYILDKIDDLLWIHYGDEMVALLTEDTVRARNLGVGPRDQAQ